ncbi:MAG: hypothetical protein K8S27_01260 [Candidatus Omnitrophica bacterium]|nr:hypothetical protein [Candidatus Omnitrophota bacterium]
MGRSSKKPRKKMDPRQSTEGKSKEKKEERDWSFDEIARSKTRRRY